MILGMAIRYIKLSNYGTTYSQRRDSDDAEIATTIVIARMKRRWGGSTPGLVTRHTSMTMKVLTKN
jgi:hypothetical protein